MDELMEFTMLKSKLYLKLVQNDATYTEELASILPILPNTAPIRELKDRKRSDKMK